MIKNSLILNIYLSSFMVQKFWMNLFPIPCIVLRDYFLVEQSEQKMWKRQLTFYPEKEVFIKMILSFGRTWKKHVFPPCFKHENVRKKDPVVNYRRLNVATVTVSFFMNGTHCSFFYDFEWHIVERICYLFYKKMFIVL